MDIIDKLFKIKADIEKLFELEEDSMRIGYEIEFGFYRVFHSIEELETIKENRAKIRKTLRNYLTKEELRNVEVVFECQINTF